MQNLKIKIQGDSDKQIIIAGHINLLLSERVRISKQTLLQNVGELKTITAI